MTDVPERVVVVGGDGEFGRFLRADVLPALGVEGVRSLERDVPREAQEPVLAAARHVVVATPLAGYAERACELVYLCRDVATPSTLWLIPSVQAGVWRALTATLSIVGNPYLSAVFVHPMYGPNGFRATEPEARTFQNVLTARHEGAAHPISEELERVAQAFRERLRIETSHAFDPEEHDRITAYSQGLSYCAARVMFERADVDAAVRERMPDLHHAFHANHDLIVDFLRINAYMPQVAAAFADAWRRTAQTGVDDLLVAFATADAALNRGAESPIPTKWYEQLRAAASP